MKYYYVKTKKRFKKLRQTIFCVQYGKLFPNILFFKEVIPFLLFWDTPHGCVSRVLYFISDNAYHVIESIGVCVYTHTDTHTHTSGDPSGVSRITVVQPTHPPTLAPTHILLLRASCSHVYPTHKPTHPPSVPTHTDLSFTL